MKQGGSGNTEFKRKLLAVSVAACFVVSAQAGPALPTGASGVVGVTGISQAGSTLTVNTTGNSVLNYTSFSIGAGATVQINQQSAAFASLQRVIGAGGLPGSKNFGCTGLGTSYATSQLPWPTPPVNATL